MRTLGLTRLVAFGLVMVAALIVGAPAGQAAPTVLRARMTVALASAPVGTEVPFTLTVTLGGKAVKGVPVVVQVLDESGTWRRIDSYRTNRQGRVEDTLTGYVPGYVGRYRALVMGTQGSVLVRSNEVAVSWTAKASDGREPS